MLLPVGSTAILKFRGSSLVILLLTVGRAWKYGSVEEGGGLMIGAEKEDLPAPYILPPKEYNLSSWHAAIKAVVKIEPSSHRLEADVEKTRYQAQLRSLD